MTAPTLERKETHSALIRRMRLAFPPTGEGGLEPRVLRALELELAALGFVASTRLRARLERLSIDQVEAYQSFICGTLSASLGADQTHRPLFRKFPDRIPENTEELWFERVLVHFLQREDTQCIHCLGVGTTHVLSPCQHVVCSRCFDGGSYSGCPICNRRVDEPSPFIEPSRERPLAQEHVRFKVLDLGHDFETAARELFRAFCARAQAMSPEDRQDLEALVRDFAGELPVWMPAEIPVKENLAIVFGTLLRICPADVVLATARPYLRTATDVLRMIAEYSGADPALQGEYVLGTVLVEEERRWWGIIARLLRQPDPGPYLHRAQVPVKAYRFKVARLSRRLRRSLLAILEGFDPQLLIEDMLRHRSYWVWLGEFLHPHEYARRFPNVATAFAIVRKRSPSGQKAPRFETFHGKVEAEFARGDVRAALTVLQRRPGELARKLDHALRTAGCDEVGRTDILGAFRGIVDRLPTPILLTLRSHFRARTAPAPVRVYWPKGGTAGVVSRQDARASLDAESIRCIVDATEAALLTRFAALPPAPVWVLDRALDDVVAPFNERTTSPGAITLPRGSTIDAPIPSGKFVRFFLHWCEPERGGFTTDLDLSVGLYAPNWDYKGVCSYYELSCKLDGVVVAKSAGDLTSAPFPDGSSEFVDVDPTKAGRAGIRYVVMVVNAYSGMAMGALERAFAGIMVREDPGGRHFDPRTVELRFNLQGARGIFVPMVFDLQEKKLHWLDVYSKGMPALNNVHTSNRAIQKICPELISYFESGVRTSVYQLALLHAAARGREVFVRAESMRRFERGVAEPARDFLRRLQSDEGEPTEIDAFCTRPEVTAMLFRGDLVLDPGTDRYVLFPQSTAGTLAASDLAR